MTDTASAPDNILIRIVKKFITSHLSIILIIISLSLGIAAVLVTPREEGPQIVVPLADVYITAPGASPREIEKLVATPMERLLWQIDGVELLHERMSGLNVSMLEVFKALEGADVSVTAGSFYASTRISRSPAMLFSPVSMTGPT